MREDAAPEESAELAFDEVGQPDPVGARGGRGEEAFQVFVDDPMQDRVSGGARDIGSHGAGPSGFRAVATAVPLDVRTAYTWGPRRRGATTVATERCADALPEPIAVTRYDRGPRARLADHVVGDVVLLGVS
jgi:hypothetical protein